MNFIDYEKCKLKTEDIHEVNLLEAVLSAQRLGLISNLIGQLVTILSIEEVYMKYGSTSYVRHDLNKLALISLVIGVVAGIKALDISTTRYEDLKKKLEEGKINYSLQPNADINLANALGIISSAFGIVGVLGIRNRNGIVPIV